MELTCDSFTIVENICSQTFGPNGVAALIQSSSGFMSITRSGAVIIHSVFKETNNKSIFSKILLENIKRVQQSLGDGIKSYVLLKISLLQFLKETQLKNQLSPHYMCRELQNLHETLSRIVTSLPVNICFQSKENCMKATSALFSTSCSQTVSGILQNIFHDWFNSSLCTSFVKDRNITSQLNFLVKYFNLLCLKRGYSATSESHILQGYLVDRTALNLSKCEEEKVYAVFYIPSENADTIDICNEVYSLINEISPDISVRLLIISSAVLSNEILFNLQLRNIVVLHGVTTDDVNFISRVLSQNSHSKSSCITVKLCVFGNKECTCLILPSIFQLVICAPTDALANEYVCVCNRALKVLLTSSNSSYPNGLIKAGGNFERTLHFHIASEINQIADPLMFNIHNRNDLIRWHLQNQLRRGKLFSHDNTCESVNSKVSVPEKPNIIQIKSKDFNLEESNKISLREIMSKYQRHEIDKCNIQQLVNDYFTIYSKDIVFPSVKHINKHILIAIARTLSGICGYFSDEMSSEIFEPVAIRILLLQYVLSSVISILKCEDYSVFRK